MPLTPLGGLAGELRKVERRVELSEEIMRGVAYLGEAMTALAIEPLLEGEPLRHLVETGAVELTGGVDMPAGWRPSFVEGWHVTSVEARLLMAGDHGGVVRLSVEVEGTQTFLDERQRWHRDIIIKLRLVEAVNPRP